MHTKNVVIMPTFKDITGKKFGNLVVESLSDKITCVSNGKGGKRRRYQWVCRCDCGNTIIACTDHLRSGHTKHCRYCPEFAHQFRKIPGGNLELYRRDSTIKQMINRLRHRAKKRKMEWNLDVEFLTRLFEKQKGICALSGLELVMAGSVSRHRKGETTASIDRIDSSKGYTKGNIQWLHKRVNNMKNDLLDSEFIELCRKIAQTNKRKRTS